MRYLLVGIISTLALFFGVSGKVSATPNPESSLQNVQSLSAGEFLKQFLNPNANLSVLTSQLIPLPDEYRLVFKPAFVARATKQYMTTLSTLSTRADFIGPGPGQTELL